MACTLMNSPLKRTQAFRALATTFHVSKEERGVRGGGQGQKQVGPNFHVQELKARITNTHTSTESLLDLFSIEAKPS